MLADYHTHTPLCKHAEGTPEEFVEAAVAAELKEYGVSDHAPQLPEPFDDWRMSWAELPDYGEWVERARDCAGGRIAVRAGLECDWLRGNEGVVERLAGAGEWDYLIGSVHYIVEGAGKAGKGGKYWDFDNPVWLGRWAQTDVERAWEIYWAEYRRMVESGLFDIMGHADLIKKFGYTPGGDLDRFYAPVIEALVEKEAAIELNTAGWNKPCAEQYPADRFLSLAAEAGVALVISSDAHQPSELGQYFERARALAVACGFQGTALFEQRRRSFLPFQ